MEQLKRHTVEEFEQMTDEVFEQYSEALSDLCFELGIDANGAEDYMKLAEEMTGEERPSNWKYKVLESWLSDEERKDDAGVIEQLTNLKKKDNGK